ncbi:MAG: response regulator transcription factor [Bacteroidales bacterium]|nr:MAG: response regulator transcription factor [Bacteroidales bacterium]
MLKALIVDDEIASVRTLELLLSQFAKDIEVVDVARSSIEALSKVELIKPDIVFLDIEMPGGSGFDFLENCSSRDFDVIFITAFEYYAVKAFKFSAIDYLLKPIEVEELESALARVSKRRYSNFDGRKRYYALFENLKEILPSKLVVNIQNKSEFIDLKDVYCFEESQKGTIVLRSNGESLSIDNRLKDLEEILDTKNFVRINSKQVINLTLVKHIGKAGSIDLDKGIKLTASSEYINELIDQLEVFVKQK